MYMYDRQQTITKIVSLIQVHVIYQVLYKPLEIIIKSNKVVHVNICCFMSVFIMSIYPINLSFTTVP